MCIFFLEYVHLICVIMYVQEYIQVDDYKSKSQSHGSDGLKCIYIIFLLKWLWVILHVPWVFLLILILIYLLKGVNYLTDYAFHYCITHTLL